jgi:hypothetical protein
MELNLAMEVLVVLVAVIAAALLGGLFVRYAGQTAAAQPVVEADRMRTVLIRLTWPSRSLPPPGRDRPRVKPRRRRALRAWPGAEDAASGRIAGSRSRSEKIKK